MMAATPQELKDLVRSTTALSLEKRLDVADAAGGVIPARPAGQRRDRSEAEHQGLTRNKMERECISLTKDERALIPEISLRAAREGRTVLKSHILRAALIYLASSTTENLTNALDRVQKAKPGRK